MFNIDQHLSLNLSLRQFNPVTDVDDFMAWASDSNVTQFCLLEPFSSKEQALEYISNNVVNHLYYKVICLNNKVIGAISLTLNAGIHSCRTELGYILGRQYWGRGIATWAVKMVGSMIFEEKTELERVEALVGVDNVASQRVLEKAGFVKEGDLRKYWNFKGKTRDMVMFSLLRISSMDRMDES